MTDPGSGVPDGSGTGDAVTRHRSLVRIEPDAGSGDGSGPGPGPLVGVVMGSTSDWATMRHAADMLERLGVSHEVGVVSAHRTPDLLFAYATAAETRGLRVIIAGAGGAAHLPGMLASKTVVPVLGVPVKSRALAGMDSLLSIVQMPRGIAVGTLAIGDAGSANAGLLAAQIIATTDDAVRARLHTFRSEQTGAVLDAGLDAFDPTGGAS